MKSAFYGALAAFVAMLAAMSAYFSVKADSANKKLDEVKNKLSNSDKHLEQAIDRELIDEELDDFSDVYLSKCLRKNTDDR
jgi:cell division protein FtsL